MKLFIGSSEEIYKSLANYHVIEISGKEKRIFEKISNLAAVDIIAKEKAFLINEADKLARGVQLKLADTNLNLFLSTYYPEKIVYQLRNKCQIVKIESLGKHKIEQAIIKIFTGKERIEALEFAAEFPLKNLLVYLSENLTRFTKDAVIIKHNSELLQFANILLYKTNDKLILSFVVMQWTTIPKGRSVQFPLAWHKKKKEKKTKPKKIEEPEKVVIKQMTLFEV